MQDEWRSLETLSMLLRLNHEVIASFFACSHKERLTAHNENVALSLETQLTFRKNDCTIAAATLPCFVLTFAVVVVYLLNKSAANMKL
jgi:hypothetical protein